MCRFSLEASVITREEVACLAIVGRSSLLAGIFSIASRSITIAMLNTAEHSRQ